jgi:hypothetical protein
MELVRELRANYDLYGFETKMLAASRVFPTAAFIYDDIRALIPLLAHNLGPRSGSRAAQSPHCRWRR